MYISAELNDFELPREIEKDADYITDLEDYLNAYYEHIYIDNDVALDEEYTTEQDDSFTYRDLLIAFNNIQETDDLLDELTDYSDDEYEDEDDEDIF